MAGYQGIEESSEAESQPSGGSAAAISHTVSLSCASADAEASSPERSISRPTIAVLPFADMSQKKDQEFFGDGMAEEILDLLAKIPGLTVIGRTSKGDWSARGLEHDLRYKSFLNNMNLPE